MKAFKSVFDKVLAVLLSIMIFSMVCVALLGVFSRLVVGKQPSFTTEYLRYALLWLSLLAAAYGFGEKGHISITFLKDKFKGKGLLALNVFTELAILFFAVAVLVYGGIQGVKLGMNEISPTLYLKVGYIYTVLPISGVFIVFYSIDNLIDLFKKRD